MTVNNNERKLVNSIVQMLQGFDYQTQSDILYEATRQCSFQRDDRIEKLNNIQKTEQKSKKGFFS